MATSQGVAAGGDSRVAVNPHLAVAALAVTIAGLGARFLFVAWKYSVNVFFWDQWEYLNPFFHGQPRLAELFLYEFPPTRGGVGLVADWFLFSLTRWNARADSFLVAGCIFAAMLVALRLKCRLFGPITIHDLAIPAMFLTLAQYETLIGIPHPSWRGFPLLMIMLYCLALLERRSWKKYTVLLLMNILLIYTGYGLFMGLITLGLFAFECYWSIHRKTKVPLALPIIALLIAAASLGSFFVHYTLAGGTECVEPIHYLWNYPWFMAIMFSRFLVRSSGLFLITLMGATLLLVALTVLVFHLAELTKSGHKPAPQVGAVLLGYSLLFAATTAIGRTCLGLPEAAQASRYVTLMIPAFLGLYFYLLPGQRARDAVVARADSASALNGIMSLTARARYALPLFVALMLAGAVLKKTRDLGRFSEHRRAWADCYRKTEDIYGCNQATNFKIFPYPESTNLQQKLIFLKERRLNLFADSGGE